MDHPALLAAGAVLLGWVVFAICIALLGSDEVTVAQFDTDAVPRAPEQRDSMSLSGIGSWTRRRPFATFSLVTAALVMIWILSNVLIRQSELIEVVRTLPTDWKPVPRFHEPEVLLRHFNNNHRWIFEEANRIATERYEFIDDLCDCPSVLFVVEDKRWRPAFFIVRVTATFEFQKSGDEFLLRKVTTWPNPTFF